MKLFTILINYSIEMLISMVLSFLWSRLLQSTSWVHEM